MARGFIAVWELNCETFAKPCLEGVLRGLLFTKLQETFRKSSILLANFLQKLIFVTSQARNF
jgi:hypothetical protein